MRLFLAILLSDEMKDALIHTQNRWYDAGVRGNYTAEENLHLTLAFIGEYPDAEPVLEALPGGRRLFRRPVVGRHEGVGGAGRCRPPDSKGAFGA